MPRPKKTISREDELAKKRAAERLRYEKIKNDPERLAAQREKEKQKYLRKKEKGQRKLVSEMSDREKRQARKNWKKYSAKYYSNKKTIEKAATNFMRANTPSSLHDEPINPQSQQQNRQQLTPRLVVAKERSRRQRRNRNLELKEMKSTILKLKTRLNKYKKRYQRLKTERNQKSQELTPNSKMFKLAENPETRVDVVKKALFGDVMEKQITENICNLKTKREKQVANKLLLGSIVKRRKIWIYNKKVITYKKIWHSQRQKLLNIRTRRCLKKIVQAFLEDDKYSRLCAGKTEFIIKNKIKRQKRYRLDSLKNLHKEFLKSGNVTISYSMFARLTPFWIVAPKVTDRDTCMCTVHSNIQLIVTALNKAKILKVSSYQNLLNTICCDRYNERCLERTCDICSTKTVPYQEEFDETLLISYKQWSSSKETIIDPKTKKERAVVKQTKKSIELSAKELILKFENDLSKICHHERNIVHQYQTIKMLKKSLTQKDVLVHMDFSENYSTKCSEEIQSFHFGGSRTQLSLHTVVIYLLGSIRSYCTISSNLTHNVHAIWAHLKPVLEELPTEIVNIHFLSDGPVTQYRNKLMFFVLACKMPELYPRIIYWTWNYHEAGHGKGAPDGVGAVCKRTADNVVAHGLDITDLNEFCGAIQNGCPKITVFSVTTHDIEDMESLISVNQPNLTPFSGTLKIHQVQGNAFMPRKLVMKSLSCFCNLGGCEHYRLGVVEYPAVNDQSRLNVSDVFGNSDSERSDNGSPSIIDTENINSVETSLVLNSGKLLDDQSDLYLPPNLPDQEVLVDITNLSPSELFPDLCEKPILDLPINQKCGESSAISALEKPKRSRKRKLNEQDKKQKHNNRYKNETYPKRLNKRLSSRNKIKKKEPGHSNESDDCFCLFCGDSYSEDTTGNDWIQCIACHQWAHLNCVKGDPISFTCPGCSSDDDYN